MYTGLHGYGELLTFAFVAAALIIWLNALNTKKSAYLNYVWMGCLFGCAVISKSVALILFPPFLLAFFYKVLFLDKFKNKVKNTIYLLSVLFFAVVVFQGYEAFRYSKNPKNYKSMFATQKNEILRQAGLKKSKHWKKKAELNDSIASSKKIQSVVEPKTSTKKSDIKLFKHLTITADKLNIPIAVLILLFFIPSLITLLLIYQKKIPKENTVILLFLMGMINAYFFWWLVLSPTVKIDHIGKFRRLVPAFAYNAVLLSILLSYLLNQSTKFKTVGLALSLGILSWFSIGSLDSFAKIFDKTNADFENNEILTALKKYENPDVYTFGYRHAPQFLLFYDGYFTDILSKNFGKILLKENQFLLLDTYSIISDVVLPIIEPLNYSIEAIVPEAGILIKLNGVDYKSAVDAKEENLLKNCLTSTEISNYVYKEGFQERSLEKKLKKYTINWTSKVFNFNFKKGNFNSLRLKYQVPNKMKLSKNNLNTISVFLNGFYIVDLPVKPSSNDHQIYIDSDYCNKLEENKFSFVLNTKSFSLGNRYLGINLQKICFSRSKNEKFNTEKNKNFYTRDKLKIDNLGINSYAELWMVVENPTHFCTILANGTPLETKFDNKNKLKAKLPEKLWKISEFEFVVVDAINKRETPVTCFKRNKRFKQKANK